MLRTVLSHPAMGLISRLVLAGVWGYAGFTKIFEPGGARLAIIAYRIDFINPFASFLGYAVPIIEIIIAVTLLFGIFVRYSAAISGALLIMFIVAIAQVWARGYSIDCGCFGGGGDVDPAGKDARYIAELARDFLFLGFSAILYVWPRTPFSLLPERENVPDESKDDE